MEEYICLNDLCQSGNSISQVINQAMNAKIALYAYLKIRLTATLKCKVGPRFQPFIPDIPHVSDIFLFDMKDEYWEGYLKLKADLNNIDKKHYDKDDFENSNINKSKIYKELLIYAKENEKVFILNLPPLNYDKEKIEQSEVIIKNSVLWRLGKDSEQLFEFYYDKEDEEKIKKIIGVNGKNTRESTKKNKLHHLHEICRKSYGSCGGKEDKFIEDILKIIAHAKDTNSHVFYKEVKNNVGKARIDKYTDDAWVKPQALKWFREKISQKKSKADLR